MSFGTPIKSSRQPTWKNISTVSGLFDDNGHPPLIVYEEDKKLYYECLNAYVEKEELRPLTEFFRYETEKPGRRPCSL